MGDAYLAKHPLNPICEDEMLAEEDVVHDFHEFVVPRTCKAADCFTFSERSNNYAMFFCWWDVLWIQKLVEVVVKQCLSVANHRASLSSSACHGLAITDYQPMQKLVLFDNIVYWRAMLWLPNQHKFKKINEVDVFVELLKYMCTKHLFWMGSHMHVKIYPICSVE